ncbi:MAG: hypothetical protein DCC75_12580 [Proteobacteria bacterium]|nr:MAG: hypothetical protein DCC75_12580 [Pseudomonadota bacterium]
MYLTALLHGLAPMPSADPELRQNLSQLGNTELHNMLRELDSESAAALHMNDRIRVIRAIEITKLSRIARSQSSSRHAFLQQLLRAVILVPCWRRDRLSERIRQRCRRMLEQGLIEETRTTIAKYGDDLNVLRAPGYRQARQFLRGELQLPEVDLKMFQHTRQYAKRQITYWRNEPPKRGWLCLPEQDFKRDKMSRLRSAKPAADFKSLALTIPQLLVRLSDMVSKPLERNQVWFLDGEQLFSEPRSGGQPWIQRLQ